MWSRLGVPSGRTAPNRKETMMMKSIKRLMLVAAAALPLQAAIYGDLAAAQSQNGTSSLDSFRMFRSPEIIHALYMGDLPSLAADKRGTMLYLLPIIEAFEAPDAWFRIGMDVEAMLDPQLGPTARGIAMTDPDFMRFFMNRGMSVFTDIMTGWAGERRRQIEQNVFDPAGEFTALTRGLLRGQSDLVRLKADASMDAKRLMVVARDDPESFMHIYDGIRGFIYSY